MNPLRRLKSLMNRRHAADFWTALRRIRHELKWHEITNHEFPLWECSAEDIQDALRTLDRWLDVANEKGWGEYDDA